MNIFEACADRNLFKPWFRNAATWRAWFAFLAALFGLEMDAEQRAIFEKCTGRSEPPANSTNETWLVVGRRGGKSFVLALVAVFLAAFHDWRPYLQPGERATVMIIAADRRQARVIMRYVRGLLDFVPMLRRMVENERAVRAESVDLINGSTIEIHSASWRSTRGYTVVAALLDEIAFWRTGDDAANPDHEILAALRPAMATIPGAKLIAASSPYSRRGALYQTWKQHYGKDSPVLVWQAETRVMNPTVSERVITEAYERDPASAAAEYGAQFRRDIEAFLGRESVEAVTIPGRLELPPVPGLVYKGFVDPSGGSADSMTLGIAHAEGRRRVLDCVRERRPPFSPEAVVADFAQTLRTYGLSSVTGDRYAGEWPRERFKVHGVKYVLADKPKSDFYRDMLPCINAGEAELLDVPRLHAQLVGLERRTSRAGKDSIDHGPGAHDDVANACAGVLGLVGASAFRRRTHIVGI